MEWKVTPTRTDNSINYSFFFLMIVSIVAFHYLVNHMENTQASELVLFAFSIVNPTATGLIALAISFRYQSSGFGIRKDVFRLSYLIFSAAFLAAAGGEVLFFVYDYFLEEPAFPSPADILFAMIYPFILVYIYLNTSFGKQAFEFKHLWIIILPTFIIVFYHLLLGKQEHDLEYFIGVHYVVVSAVTLSFAIYAVLIFKDSILGKTWLLMLFGIIPFTAADIIYYNLEAVNGYDLAHPVNLLWYVGYWIITYALYKHPSGKIEGTSYTISH